MTENYLKVTKKAHNRNRNVRRQARKQVEDKLTKKYGDTPSARVKAKEFMKNRDVHKTNRGLELIDHKEHGKKHGRGHRGKPRVYRNK